MKKHYLPRLMMPCMGYYSQFHSILVNKTNILHIDLKQLYNKRCLGSSHGWLIMSEEESPSIFAVNPLKILKTRIHLPSLLTFPYVLDFNGDEYLEWTPFFGLTRVSSRLFMNTYLRKVILSKNPTVEGCMAVAIFGAREKLAVCKVGDEEWEIIDSYCGEIVGYRDVVFDQEGEYFYAVNSFGAVVAGDPGRSSLYLVYDPLVSDYADWKYLAFNAKGKLMLINRYSRYCMAGLEDDEEEIKSGSDEEMEESSSDYDWYGEEEDNSGCDEEIEECSYESSYKTWRFRVFRMDEEIGELEEINSLEDEVLFVGDNESLCLSSREFPGCKGGCVYFTDDSLEARDEPSIGARDIGVFDLKDGCVERFQCVENEDEGIWPPPIWAALALPPP